MKKSKSNPHLKSIFEQISERVFQMKDLKQAKDFVTEFVEGKDINEKNKLSILNEVKNAPSLVRFQTYLCNSLLKYEGMGVYQINKTSREAAHDEAILDH